MDERFSSYMEENNNFKCGYAAIIGEPNVGKSTLINVVLDQKISIVTKKPQTTRQRVLGILNKNNLQIIFLDTPGLIIPKYLLQKEMIAAAKKAILNADIVLAIISADKYSISEHVLEQIILNNNKNNILVINKIDLLNNKQLEHHIKRLQHEKYFKEIIPISAKKNINIDKLIDTIDKYLPYQQALYPNDIISEQPEKFFVAEFIRENIFISFHEEIPYSTAVEITEFKEREKRKIFIRANIVVERESQKGIIIGKNGEALKRVGIKARQQIEEFLGCDIYLELHVKVKERWRDNEMLLKRFGYNSSSEK